MTLSDVAIRNAASDTIGRIANDANFDLWLPEELLDALPERDFWAWFGCLVELNEAHKAATKKLENKCLELLEKATLAKEESDKHTRKGNGHV